MVCSGEEGQWILYYGLDIGVIMVWSEKRITPMLHARVRTRARARMRTHSRANATLCDFRRTLCDIRRMTHHLMRHQKNARITLDWFTIKVASGSLQLCVHYPLDDTNIHHHSYGQCYTFITDMCYVNFWMNTGWMQCLCTHGVITIYWTWIITVMYLLAFILLCGSRPWVKSARYAVGLDS